MDFEFTEEQKMLKEAIRNFAQKEVAPLVEYAEEHEKFPVELYAKMGALGYLCVDYPAKYGGAEMGMVGECLLVEELSKVDVGIAAALMVQSGIGTRPILMHGTEEQKQEYIVPSIKGQKISAFGLTEPNAGSDVGALQTIAVKKGDKYVISGNKTYISNGPICDFVLVAAYTNKSLGPGKGISLFIVDKGIPGFTWKKMKKFATRSTDTAELFFDESPVPAGKMVGEEGRGFSYVMECLDGGRISHSATSVGVAQAAYEASVAYAQQRVQFGQPIYKFQANSFKLARMAVEIEAARWLMYRAAWLYDQGVQRIKEAAMTKLFASEVAARVTTEAMQIHGGVALMSDSPVNRYFRDARRSTITEGTSEIQQIVIARGIGLP